MPNYPYKSLGTDLNRDFRNDLNENFKDVESDLRDMQTNFNEVVETVSEKAFDKVVDAAKIDWLSPVNTFNDLSTTYPDAIEGKTSMARDTGKVYRMTNSQWQEIQDIDPSAINEVDNRLTAQLADMERQKADQDYVTTLINSISGGGPRDVYYTLSALQSAYPNGSSGVYLVLDTDPDNPHKYAWSSKDSAWVDLGVYQWDQIPDGSVTIQKTDNYVKDLLTGSIKGNKGKNLFDKNAVIPDMFVRWDTGDVSVPVDGSTDYNASDWIPVLPNTTYTLKTINQSAFYDSNRKYISGIEAMIAEPYTFTTPDNCYYFRTSVRDAYLDDQQLEIGSRSTDYEPYIVKVDINTINDGSLPGSKLAKKSVGRDILNILPVEGIVGKNLFDKTTVVSDMYVAWQTGILQKNTTYAFSNRFQVAWYDEDKNYISGNDPGYPSTGAGAGAGALTSPDNACYLRTSVLKTNLDTFQLELGNNPTDYEPYTICVSEDQLDSNLKNKLNSLTFQSGKIINFIGDSIVYGYESGTGNRVANPYPSVVGDLLGATINNYGINGSTIAGDSSNGIGYQPIIERYTNMDNDADYVIVAAGTNDFGSDKRVPLGSITDTVNISFYGALNNLCLGLIQKYPDAQIMFITPLKRGTMTTTEGLTLEQFANAIKEVCDIYSIPVFDMYTNSGFHVNVPAWQAVYSPDKLHGTQDWYNIHGRKVANFIKTL